MPACGPACRGPAERARDLAVGNAVATLAAREALDVVLLAGTASVALLVACAAGAAGVAILAF